MLLWLVNFGLLLVLLAGYWLSSASIVSSIVLVLVLAGYFSLLHYTRNRFAANAAPAAPRQPELDISKIEISTSKLAIGSAEVSYFIDSLNNDIKLSAQHSSQIADNSSELSHTGSQLNDSLQTLNKSIQQTASACQQADQQLDSSVNSLEQLASSVSHSAKELEQLRNSADNIQRITEVINNVADQTNLLALNAAIEAARAGEQGRGFAVVAEEVRALASKTSGATADIAKMLAEIRQQSGQTADQMSLLVAKSSEVQQQLQQVTTGFTRINSEIGQAAAASSQLESAGSRLAQTSTAITQAISNVSSGLNAIEQKGSSIANQAIDLSMETESIYRELSQLEHQSFYSPILAEAKQAAEAIGSLLQQGISSGKFTEQQLFAKEYQPIANTNPQKFHTAYDSYTDQVFGQVQEPILNRHSQVLYAGAVDRKGYFPTHNKKFSQPLSGDYNRDLLANRSKRIFADRTGSRCGSNTEAMLLQTYKRDTGEILHDLSVPIFVNGKHWGGFRIGFKR
ncbi:methyl-accepting chemotaxis protein [Arsukibacterium sp.]|uniref:methyl-accepting chemotaxis protein n=1 Tax=Arsukibacterium sp. TaxID=1977258 RepID=UPI00262B16F6|nr:methyl-accepting chemotaxis protein [Arsukibacterium sp.]